MAGNIQAICKLSEAIEDYLIASRLFMSFRKPPRGASAPRPLAYRLCLLFDDSIHVPTLQGTRITQASHDDRLTQVKNAFSRLCCRIPDGQVHCSVCALYLNCGWFVSELARNLADQVSAHHFLQSLTPIRNMSSSTTPNNSTRSEDDSYDISSFLRRLDDLKQQTSLNDNGRSRALEEEIEAAKRQRLARRAARARGRNEKLSPRQSESTEIVQESATDSITLTSPLRERAVNGPQRIPSASETLARSLSSKGDNLKASSVSLDVYNINKSEMLAQSISSSGGENLSPSPIRSTIRNLNTTDALFRSTSGKSESVDASPTRSGIWNLNVTENRTRSPFGKSDSINMSLSRSGVRNLSTSEVLTRSPSSRSETVNALPDRSGLRHSEILDTLTRTPSGKTDSLSASPARSGMRKSMSRYNLSSLTADADVNTNVNEESLENAATCLSSEITDARPSYSTTKLASPPQFLLSPKAVQLTAQNKIKQWETAANTDDIAAAIPASGDDVFAEMTSMSRLRPENVVKQEDTTSTIASLSRSRETTSQPPSASVENYTDKQPMLFSRSDKYQSLTSGVGKLSLSPYTQTSQSPGADRSSDSNSLDQGSSQPISAKAEYELREREMADREEERLSKFLRSGSQRTSIHQKNKLNSNYPTLSPSNALSSPVPAPATPPRSLSASPVRNPPSSSHSLTRTATLRAPQSQMQTRSANTSPSRTPTLRSPQSQSPTRSGSVSPFRSNRYSGVGTFASSDFYSDGTTSPADFERGYVGYSHARTDSIGSQADSSRSPSPIRSRSPTKFGFVQSAMLKREGTVLSKRLSMANLKPAPAVLNSPKQRELREQASMYELGNSFNEEDEQAEQSNQDR
ncbi:uncharacterized protein V1518DRAFT_410605 [Limtongia smithiae]|uniref:uncharacterized protein n=1 Tax=Limtongia smithiae TaxID=1125753 RepID=UPI0034CE9868